MCFSSLYIGILAATLQNFTAAGNTFSFSSLYIGILAATKTIKDEVTEYIVSVPFTSGSSLQPSVAVPHHSVLQFQFPLHRDPRCNHCGENDRNQVYATRFSSLYIGILAATPFFSFVFFTMTVVSVPFTSGSSLQLLQAFEPVIQTMFQFPLHRDPRCNPKILPP